MAESTVARPAPAPPNTPGPLAFPGLNGLRAIAALLVLVTHVSINATGNRGRFAEYFARMDVGVSIFFVLSGFLLYRPFVAHRLAGRPRPGLRRYARNRLLRVVPLYWFALTVALFLYRGPTRYHLGDLAGFYTFTYVYRPLLAMFGLVTFTALTVYGGIRFRTRAELALVVVDAGIGAVLGERAGRSGREPPAPAPDRRASAPPADRSPARADDRIPVTP